jgi:hypothetical protein
LDQHQEDINNKPFYEHEYGILEDQYSYTYWKDVDLWAQREPREVPTECPICFGDIGNNDKVISLPKCGHFFHWKCLEVWLRQKLQCPMCRAGIRRNMLLDFDDIKKAGQQFKVGPDKRTIPPENPMATLHDQFDANELEIINFLPIGQVS